MDKSWTLFLDRDGVINKKAEKHHYISSIEEFIFLPGALNAIKILSDIFGHIVVVTNQQGVEKGLIDLNTLYLIHAHMIDVVAAKGGRIDHVEFCPHLEGMCDCRKPQIGMALKVREHLSGIDFINSCVVGDSDSDIEFGKRIGAKTVRVSEDYSLLDFAVSLL